MGNSTNIPGICGGGCPLEPMQAHVAENDGGHLGAEVAASAGVRVAGFDPAKGHDGRLCKADRQRGMPGPSAPGLDSPARHYKLRGEQ